MNELLIYISRITKFIDENGGSVALRRILQHLRYEARYQTKLTMAVKNKINDEMDIIRGRRGKGGESLLHTSQ